jgi:hypothetical protein
MFVRGYLTNKKIFAIDINSSYPGQMRNYDYPTGPYYKLDLANVKYSGQKLILGIYQVHIQDSPMSNYPIFFTTVDGISQPSTIRNTTMWATSAEIEYAY